MSVERQLPEGWRWVTFGDVARQLKEDADPDSGELERYVGGEHMQTDDLRIRHWGTIGDGYLGPAFHRRFRTGQILYGSRRTYLRKVARAHFDGICANTTFVIEAKTDIIDAALLPFIMQSEGFNEHSVRNSKGSVNPYVNWKDIASYEFPLPPLDEQRRIAEILWAVEEAIEEYLVVENTIRNAKKVFAKEQFESLPCENLTFRQVGDWLSGGTPSRNNPSFWNGDIPWASPKDMKVAILFDTEEHVSAEGLQYGSRIIPTNSVLFVVRGMILAHSFPVALTGTQMAFNQDLRAIVPNEQFDPYFIFYWIQYNASKFLTFVTESSHGTKRLSSSILEAVLFPEITLDEQKGIAGQLDAFDRQVYAVLHQLQALRELKTKVIHRLLDGASTNVQ